MALVLIQPDLGTTLTYAPILVAGLFLGGINVRQALILSTCAIVLIGRVWTSGKMQAYEARLRFHQLTTAPRAAATGCQSLIAVGSGGIWGKGAEKGTADPGLLSSHSLHRFHLRRLQRGARVCGRDFSAAAILFNIDAFDSKRSNSS